MVNGSGRACSWLDWVASNEHEPCQVPGGGWVTRGCRRFAARAAGLPANRATRSSAGQAQGRAVPASRATRSSSVQTARSGGEVWRRAGTIGRDRVARGVPPPSASDAPSTPPKSESEENRISDRKTRPRRAEKADDSGDIALAGLRSRFSLRCESLTCGQATREDSFRPWPCGCRGLSPLATSGAKSGRTWLLSFRRRLRPAWRYRRCECILNHSAAFSSEIRPSISPMTKWQARGSGAVSSSKRPHQRGPGE